MLTEVTVKQLTAAIKTIEDKTGKPFALTFNGDGTCKLQHGEDQHILYTHEYGWYWVKNMLEKVDPPKPVIDTRGKVRKFYEYVRWGTTEPRQNA